MGRVEVHILDEPVEVDEVIAGPSGWQRRQRQCVELERDLVAGAKHDELILGGREKGRHRAVFRVEAAMPRVPPVFADLAVDILQIRCRRARQFTREAAEGE